LATPPPFTKPIRDIINRNWSNALKLRILHCSISTFSDFKDGVMASTILLSLPFVLLPSFAAFTYYLYRQP
jgi:hypothetical protein